MAESCKSTFYSRSIMNGWHITGGGIDYVSGPYTVVFLAGQTIATFDIPIVDDIIFEGNENFMLTINSTSLPSNVTVDNPGEATVTIVDNDCKC